MRRDAGVDRTYEFLVGRRAQGGVLQAAEGDLHGLALPLSFVDSAEYWGEHVCRLPGAACAVDDVYRPADYTLTPRAGAGAKLQLERVMAHAGTNIYDAATWQIAVILSKGDGRANRHALSGDLGRALALRRATTRGTTFVYQGERVVRPERAYAFRAVSAWLVRDPLAGTRFDSLIEATALPPNHPDYRRGYVTWTDWKPITGENAWALLIGPLQAAYLHHVRDLGGHYVPFADAAVQQALRVLPTFAAMQSPLGAVYYAPAGTSATSGEGRVNPYDVSVENNFSLYAGLKILSTTLQATRGREPGLSATSRQQIDAALSSIETMLHGGRHTAGLLDFFRHSAWRDGEFTQGGLANTADGGAWIPSLDVKAVDVQTWGIAALGGGQIDEWFGFGAAFELWQRTKRWGGYGVGRTLWGVGYSDRDGNGIDADGRFRQGVLSAEWTAGAINMVRGLARHYESVKDVANRQLAQRHARSLRDDEAAMLAGVQTLRFDRYVATDFPGKPARYEALMGLARDSPARGAYLYASRRHAIPFGWYANPLPSTCASAWMIMLAHDFDPFAYAGKSL